MEEVTKIGKYEVLEVLGRGGMGVVYKAMDPGIHRLVAIKMMTGGFADNPDLLKRFYREARSTGTLQHPNIVIVYDLGEEQGNPYLVMEYLQGQGLDKMISQRQPMTMVRKLEIVIDVCNALNYAHARGVVHRDVKPANVLVLHDNGVKLVDFGIARIGGDALTRTGQVVGTLHYMSPEQIMGQVVDGRSDIFSAAVMLYQLLTYSLPFDCSETAALLMKIIHEPAPPLSSTLQNCPPDLEQALQKGLAKDREERYATAEDFAFDLGRVRENLKRQLVDQYVADAGTAVGKAEFTRAKELLLEVLKVDSQNVAAKELLQQAQQMLQRQQRSEQVRQLRAMAEDAIAHELHADALGYVDQALALDKTNAELISLHDSVQRAKEHRERLEEALRRAEAAQQANDFDAAKAAAEEALHLDGNNTRARALHLSVVKQLAELTRQKQVQDLLSEAQREIASRHFTASCELLKKAEALDPAAPEVHALLSVATAGREQEARRRELERFNREIEDALNSEDYQSACAKADEALEKFAADPGLLKLRALAVKQRETAERRRYLEEQMSAARALLDQGRAGEALEALEAAAKKTPGDARLLSLLAIVRDNVERTKLERRRQEFVGKAKEALRNRQYEAAIKVLEEALREIEDSAEVHNLLQFAREEAAQAAHRQRVDAAANEAQRLVAAEQYENAISLLESTLQEVPDEELRLVLAEVRRRLKELEARIQNVVARAARLLEENKPDDATALLEAQPKSFARSGAFCELLEKARTAVQHATQLHDTLEHARAALAHDDFATAISTLQKCREKFGELPEIQKALAEVGTKQVASTRTAVEAAVRDARILMVARQYRAALQALDAVADQAASAPSPLRAQFESLHKDAAAGAERAVQEVATSETVIAGSATGVDYGVAAATQVAGVVPPASSQAAAAAATAAREPVAEPKAAPPAPARPATVTKVRVATPAPAAKVQPAPAAKNRGLIIAIAAAVIIAAVVGGYFVLGRKPAAVAPDAYVAINAVPWGTVKTIRSLDGKTQIAVNQQTPLRVAVPAGEYNVTVAGPDGGERSEQVKTSAEAPAVATVVFETIDVDAILNSH